MQVVISFLLAYRDQNVAGCDEVADDRENGEVIAEWRAGGGSGELLAHPQEKRDKAERELTAMEARDECANLTSGTVGGIRSRSTVGLKGGRGLGLGGNVVAVSIGNDRPLAGAAGLPL